jgi:hypothetical protein
VAFSKGAKDWITNIKIGFDVSDTTLNEGFEPEWHHFFPKKILRDYGYSTDMIDALANYSNFEQARKSKDF